MNREKTKLLEKFDKDGDKRLNSTERKAAREFLATEKAEGRGPRRFGPPRGNTEDQPVQPGAKVAVSEVKTFPNEPLYAPNVLRTIFIDFENSDWEKELADFNNSDVEVPAKLIVDGKVYPDVGVHFRGASSFFTVSEGRKRSLNLSLDFQNKEQHLGGYRTLNLLNSHTDPTFQRTVLYHHVARQYLPAPKVNYVRLVINGENWGVYVNAQQFNKEFIKENFATIKGARWKVPGSPRATGGLTYIGDDVTAYKKSYEIKTKDDPKAWKDLVNLCKVLNRTPTNELAKALAPILDVDGALKFLALENALINADGYWIRTSDYSIYQDEKGKFHLFPHDANETFRLPEGPGANLGQAGVELSPLTGAEDPAKPLLSKLLAVPALREKYLGYVRDIAEKWLDWNKLQTIIASNQALIAEEVKNDPHKLYSVEAFTNGVSTDTEEQGFRGPQRSISLKNFVEKRRAFLLGFKGK